jgi:hypothetical protein
MPGVGMGMRGLEKRRANNNNNNSNNNDDDNFVSAKNYCSVLADRWL